jgi:hypothetical protein
MTLTIKSLFYHFLKKQAVLGKTSTLPPLNKQQSFVTACQHTCFETLFVIKNGLSGLRVKFKV